MQRSLDLIPSIYIHTAPMHIHIACIVSNRCVRAHALKKLLADTHACRYAGSSVSSHYLVLVRKRKIHPGMYSRLTLQKACRDHARGHI